MSYNTDVLMSQSYSLRQRVVAAVAGEGDTNPEQWVNDNWWKVITSPGWSEAWEYATDTDTADNNPDTGARPGVIGDQLILSTVQALRV
jgi:hypothetical protein